MDNSTLLLCLAAGFVAWYFYNKFRESEGAYVELYSKMCSMETQNEQLKLRMDDLQTYKHDVSHTLKILDKELLTIHEHLASPPQPTLTARGNRVSVLTPDILTSLFAPQQSQPPLPQPGSSEEQTQSPPPRQLDTIEELHEEAVPGVGELEDPKGDYDRFLIDG